MTIFFDFEKPVSIPDIILIVTLLILIWQTWLLRKTIRSNTIQSLYNRYFDLDRLAIEFPEFQKYATRAEIYERIKDLSVEDLKKKSFIELVLDLCEFIYYQKKLGVYPGDLAYIDSVMTNPHIQEYWHTMRGAYDKDFVEYVEKCFPTQEDQIKPSPEKLKQKPRNYSRKLNNKQTKTKK